MLPVFNTRKCRFATEPDKAETARVVIFKEFKIYNSYTFEASYYGSDYLRKTKAIYERLYNSEYLEWMSDRYMIIQARQDIYFDMYVLEYASADLIRGINYASKTKPLLTNWFRVEPKVLIDIHVNSKRDAEGKIDE